MNTSFKLTSQDFASAFWLTQTLQQLEITMGVYLGKKGIIYS